MGATTTESGIGNILPNEWMNEGGTLNSRGMKTGLGSQSNPDHTETPRSYNVRCRQKKRRDIR